MKEKTTILSGKGVFYRIKQSLDQNERGIKDIVKDLNLKKATIYKWNEKDTIPKTQDIFKISKYLNVSLYWLLTGEDDKGLSEEERKLLKDFDNLSQQGKMLAMEHIEGLLNHFPRNHTSKKSSAG